MFKSLKNFDGSNHLPAELTITDVADYMKIPIKDAFDLFHRPDFPAHRIGLTFRVKRESFLVWYEAIGK